MEAAAGLITLFAVFGGIIALLVTLERGALGRSGLGGNVHSAFEIAGGAWNAAYSSIQRAPLPLWLGGVLMLFLDGGGGGGGGGGMPSGPSSDGGELTFPDVPDVFGGIDPMVLVGIILIGMVGLTLCVGVFMALRAFVATGWIRLQERTLVAGDGDVGTLFSGGDRFWSMFGWGITKALLSVLPIFGVGLVALAVVWTAQGVPSAPGFICIGLAGLAAVVLAVWIGSGLALGDYFVALEDEKPFDALFRSLDATRGHRLQIILFAVVWSVLETLVALVGLFAFCIGIFVTAPFGRALRDNAWCRAFLLARDGRDVEAGWAS